MARKEIPNRALANREQRGFAPTPAQSIWRDPATWSFAAVAVSLITWLIHFWAIEKPSAVRTQQEIASYDKKLNEVAANTRYLNEQAKLASTTAEDLKDPVKRRTGEILLQTAELQRAKAADELLDSATPDIRFEQPPGTAAVELDGKIVIPMLIRNAGSRSAVLSNLRLGAEISANEGHATPKFTLEKCRVGYLSPGNVIPCHFVLTAGDDVANIDRVDYTYSVDTRPYMIEDTMTFGLLREIYPGDALKKRLTRTVTFSGWFVDE
ncbi:hypothetical protein [Lysobacter soli]|uniref:hypothetical protein n=1 Tax=Lysobacter soli TaxID=453783 RepID=UPI00240F9323|nr:hypothetical protein [Lysobacter soli]MDG2517807.1 hypothetical protein [Lysobacter soli]